MNIVLEDVTKRYGPKVVLDRVSVTVPGGRCVALLGPSGCGKTTLLGALAGLTDIDGGRIRSGEVTWSAKGLTVAPEQRNVGMVFQDFALWPHLNVLENVAFSLRLKKVPAREIRGRVAEVLDTVQMNGYEERYPHQLSGGQRQRVAIARAMVSEPSLMLMDEPLSSLDAKLREKMRWELLRIVMGTGITTVYVTHDQAEALSIADHVVLLNEGRVEQAGPPTAVYREPRTAFAAGFLGGANLLEGRVVETIGEWVKVDCRGMFVYAAGRQAAGRTVPVMVRPADIVVEGTPHGLGARVEAVIRQRSFQGFNWHYRAAARGAENLVLEVWDTVERGLGDPVRLWLPAERCRVLGATPAEDQDEKSA